MLRRVLARVGAGAVVAAALAACLLNGATPEAEVSSRYATVHNALTAIGLSEIGPLHDAHLADGQEEHIELDLASGCTTIVAIGGLSIADLDAALFDTAGTRVARGATHTSEATIRACVETAGHYTLNVKAMHGGGPLLVSTWSGGAPAEPGGQSREGGLARGTCDSPIPMSAGDYSGSTTRGEAHNESRKCSSTAANELVYRLDLAAREKVTITLDTSPPPDAPQRSSFDSVLYMRKGDCSDVEAEVACNDDASPPGGGSHDSQHSRIQAVVDAGTYFVFVDGYNGATGSFAMHVAVADVPPLAEVCSQAALLTPGTPVNGTTDSTFDTASASCGDGAHGPDTVYSLAIERRSRVRVVEHSDDFKPVVHLRSQCDDPDTAVGCAEGGDGTDAAFVGLLNPGSYAVFADSSQPEASGKYTLDAELAPELGAGTRGERCADAIPLVRTETSVKGDTFNARDDVAGTCGGAGAPDVVYRIDLRARTHFSAHIEQEEGHHVLVLLHGGCTGAKAEVACGKTVDHVLAPGSYFVAVDGESPAGFGAFTFVWAARDTLAQDNACKNPTLLREGDTVSGNTSAGAATDKFTPSCATSDTNGGAADLLYKVVLTSRRRVRLRLHPAGWNGVLSVRTKCVEGASVAAGEVECHTEDSADIDFDHVLDPGTYYVVVDGKDASSVGTFSLEYRTPGSHP